MSWIICQATGAFDRSMSIYALLPIHERIKQFP